MSTFLRVGLTGGIGSGKTCASDFFTELGVPVIDADVISRDVVKSGQPALNQISAVFGNEILDETGNLRRDKMRQIVFNKPEARKELEAIVHPLISREILRQIENTSFPYCIVSSPLLLESQSDLPIDRVLVIDTSEELQIARASSRDKSNDDEIRKIIDAQMPRRERLEKADDVILNDGDISTLKQQVQKYHQQYLLLSRDNEKVNVAR